MPERDDELPLLGLFQIGSSVSLLNKKAEGRFGLSITQWVLLSRLVHLPGISPLELAEATRVAPGTLTPMLKRLARKRLLCVAEDPRDSRKKVVVITRQGRRRMRGASTMIEEWSNRLRPLASEIRHVRQSLEGPALEL